MSLSLGTPSFRSVAILANAPEPRIWSESSLLLHSSSSLSAVSICRVSSISSSCESSSSFARSSCIFLRLSSILRLRFFKSSSSSEVRSWCLLIDCAGSSISTPFSLNFESISSRYSLRISFSIKSRSSSETGTAAVLSRICCFRTRICSSTSFSSSRFRCISFWSLVTVSWILWFSSMLSSL